LMGNGHKMSRDECREALNCHVNPGPPGRLERVEPEAVEGVNDAGNSGQTRCPSSDDSSLGRMGVDNLWSFSAKNTSDFPDGFEV
jgi:hypothetical protein